MKRYLGILLKTKPIINKIEIDTFGVDYVLSEDQKLSSIEVWVYDRDYS